ncbi:MAG: very short patch repair endonuclease [Hyphomicrobiaceae bacterium]
MDVLTSEQRRLCMSRNRGRDTVPELMLRKALWAAGCRYRVSAKLPGRPDIAFIRARVAVFVDGCFWHACPIHSTRPRSNSAFWAAKLERNVMRDQEVSLRLTNDGWCVFRFWEHEVRSDLFAVVDKISKAVRSCPLCPESTSFALA